MRQSFGLFQERGVLYSDIQDLVVRWAVVAPNAEKYIDDIESALIVAHAPPFNAQEVRLVHGATWARRPERGCEGAPPPLGGAIYHCEQGWPD